MSTDHPAAEVRDVPPYSRSPLAETGAISAIGTGYLGGKASGLVAAARLLEDAFPDGAHGPIRIAVPSLAVLGTGVFDAFLAQNSLPVEHEPDLSDERLARLFLKADFPFEFIGDLRAIATGARSPLAVRSSSLLEDATHEPFAGVYGTKMIPNNQPDPDLRFKKLVEAIKFVFASTFFLDAHAYRQRIGRSASDEKMAVIIQEVVGARHSDRFYPTISGVARSWNYYPTGPAKPEEGVVDLALGLGKTIVDGERCWTYSPAHPNVDPPMTIPDLLKDTQTRFWAVNLGPPPAFDPVRETEYLVRATLKDADLDGSLRFVASTYLAQNDRIVVGTGRPGPRILNFAPTIRMSEVPLNELLLALLRSCEEGLGTPVEIEFAATIDALGREPPRFGMLQVRPIVVSREGPSLEDSDLVGESVLAASERALGHGTLEDLTDIVYVRPESFRKEATRRIAGELAAVNRALREEGRLALLFVFGRLGSTDPWLGIPADWDQISQARAVVEATTPEMDVDLSQGSHFFHNVTSLRLCYFTVHHASAYPIRWELLDAMPAVSETEFVRHVRPERPPVVRVDGRRGRGVITL